jgi:hypothetical protein
MQKECFFKKIMTLQTKLLVIIHANKMSVKNETFFLKQNLMFLLKPHALKPVKIEAHLIIYLHQSQSSKDKRSNYHFS